jgi:RHS repeat-associated protein
LVKETTKTQAGTTTLQMQFDGLNRLVQKQVTHQGAGASTVASPLQTTRYLYDNAGRTSAISQTIGANANANNTLVTRYEWDARGRLIAKHLPRPMQATATQGSASSIDYFAANNAGITQLYSYDLLDQLTQIQYRQTTSSTPSASAGNLIDQIDYTYDKAGQRISRKQQNSPVVPETPMQAQYNQANRLTQLTLYPNTAQAKTYLLDYDLEGNLIKKQNSTDTSCTQDCTEYVWDANNRLAQLKINSQTTAVYSYDAQGRRVEASISTVLNGSPQSSTVQYIYEGNQAVGEVRNGQLSHSLLTGLFIDEHLARTAIATNGQTQSQAQLTDALGSVIALANAQTSGINTSYNYSPYGQTQATGETSSNNQQYTGREAGVEGEAGLYYYRARYYDPVLKRFISEDPIRLEGGLNVYAYVAGNPVSNIDPDGLQTLPMPSPGITWPNLPPVAVPPSLVPVVRGGLIGWGIGNLINPIVQPPLSTAVDWCMKNNTDDCDNEWKEALEMCADLNKKNPRRHRPITGGYSEFACARGLVSERCGGNRVIYD